MIDQTYETRRILSRALTSQWIDHYLGVTSWADRWLSIGLNNYVTSLFLQKHLGNNEYRYRLKTDMRRTCSLDIGQLPLCPVSADVKEPVLDTKNIALYNFHPDADIASPRHQLISLKAPIVLYMLERWLGKGLVQKTLNKFMVSAMSEELAKGMSTSQFLRIARKICAKVEIKSFAECWIYGAGCPRFNIRFNFNKKKMVAEFKFIQESTNSKSGVIFYVCLNILLTTQGPLTIRLIEPDGIFDTQVLLQDTQKKYVIPYHTKYKRVKKGIKKGKKGDDEDADEMEVDGDEVELIDLSDRDDEAGDPDRTMRSVY